ncbi:hypothetical protein [Nitrosomonas sp. Nm34]|uniref:hypothetical protein n=1 Tax=Nitrosomonas sp. Nm34 TaxID=1881055 RepID=UPI000B83790D|nr:hypothetical protein [Nitrosomonas sp. Nm34]
MSVYFAANHSRPDSVKAALLLAMPRISRLPEIEGDKPKKKFENYPIGYFHIDIAEIQTEEAGCICLPH